MSQTGNWVRCAAHKLIAVMAAVFVISVLSLIANPNLQTASADEPVELVSPKLDIFAQVMQDLEAIKETAFCDSFLKDETKPICSHGSVSISACESNIDLVCPFLAHPDSDSTPLACSYEVRSTDVIPPVPNVEDYATPDEFVDEDMINKLQPQRVTLEKGIDKYCQQMAKLLSSSLSSDTMDESQKTAAIESAMELAVINAQIAAEAKIVQLKAAHESEVSILRARLMQYGYIETNQQKLYQWLSPIYSNVDRNFQQIEKMTESSGQLKRCLNIIQAQLDDQPSSAGKNQLIVTRRDDAVVPLAPVAAGVRRSCADQPLVATQSTVKKVSNQFVQSQPDEDEVSAIAFEIMSLRLQQAENKIAELTAKQSGTFQQTQATEAPTHRRASYDRLTPISPLQPRR